MANEIIDLTKSPDIIKQVIYPKVVKQISEDIKSFIEDGAVILNKISISLPMENVDGWNIIAEAVVRLVSTKGVDYVKVTNIKKVCANFSMYYDFDYIASIETTFTDDLTITNIDEVIKNINNKVCRQCYKHMKHCVCRDKLKPVTILSTTDTGEVSLHPRYISSIKIEDFTGSLNQSENKNNSVDISKHESMLMSLAKTLRITNKASMTKLRDKAAQFLKEDPKIREEELAKKLIQLAGSYA